ncbi:hypothetical protein ABEY31_30350, partial [Bacillus mycoides]|uniref:hypothetical protein n=1 Tax=Bacillus mycoides TaxID=1405 RepID=UPI003D263ADA
MLKQAKMYMFILTFTNNSHYAQHNTRIEGEIMRFCIETITLWLRNNKIRTLKFEPNKVNVITGASGTGKSEIISI